MDEQRKSETNWQELKKAQENVKSMEIQAEVMKIRKDLKSGQMKQNAD